MNFESQLGQNETLLIEQIIAEEAGRVIENNKDGAADQQERAQSTPVPVGRIDAPAEINLPLEPHGKWATVAHLPGPLPEPLARYARKFTELQIHNDKDNRKFMAEAGSLLQEAKDTDKHGKHGRWLDFLRQIDLKPTTARRWMRVAKHQHRLEELGLRKTVALTRISEKRAEELVRQYNLASMPVAEVEALVKPKPHSGKETSTAAESVAATQSPACREATPMVRHRQAKCGSGRRACSACGPTNWRIQRRRSQPLVGFTAYIARRNRRK